MPPLRIYEVGETYGRLTVTKRRDQPGTPLYCRCDCGTEVIIKNAGSVPHGMTRSCGCLKRDVTVARSTKHGAAGTPLYRVWADMIARCTRPTHPRYADYGGRGIAVCERWLTSFEAYRADIGERPPGMSLDRIDNDGNYEPGNVRWATPATQSQNRRPFADKLHHDPITGRFARKAS